MESYAKMAQAVKFVLLRIKVWVSGDSGSSFPRPLSLEKYHVPERALAQDIVKARRRINPLAISLDFISLDTGCTAQNGGRMPCANNLLIAFQATIFPADNFNANEDADRLFRTMDGIACLTKFRLGKAWVDF